MVRPPEEIATVTDYVASELRAMIGSGQLAPGDPIVIEQMSQLLEVSGQPVREALKILEGEGRVSHTAHHGAQVVALSREELLEIYRLREIIEDEAIRRSVAEFPPGAVDELDRRAEVMALHVERDDVDAVQRANREFHEYLRSFNPIRRLDEVVVQLRAVSAPYRRRYLDQHRAWAQLVDDHRAIVAGIRAGDIEAVIEAVHRQRSITVQSLLAAGAVGSEP